MAAPLRRILVLHGYSQNAVIFNKRLGALRKECKDMELVIVNAPHVLQPTELFASEAAQGAAGPTAEEIQADPDTAMRAWWRANKERTQAIGLLESLDYIRDILKESKFDGVFGFSQGAAFAAVISALLERPHLHPPFLMNGEAPHPPFKFCVAVSGFRPLDPVCEPFFTPSYNTPTMHVIGKTDVVVVEERSQQLVAVSANARVEEHEGGHFVPSKGNWRKFLASYMRDPSTASLSSTSQVSSGTSTPVGSGYKEALMMKL
ncbi:serine hydrolase FSH [Panaeolus papilionaceus]|nr:serine hydrolase FSH [Panaeolus papilionaceus]